MTKEAEGAYVLHSTHAGPTKIGASITRMPVIASRTGNYIVECKIL